MEAHPAQERQDPQVGAGKWRARRDSMNAVVDNLAFAFSGLAAIWLAWLVFTEDFRWGWRLAPFALLFWLLLAYLVLPRLHKILTEIYVPNYFIGRARTSDGLLGDPINLAVMGTEAQLHQAMTRAGWIRADEVTLGSSWRIITSTVMKRSYDEAPVSPLLLFGHQQDLAYQQEVEGNPAKRHHVRFWRCPEGWLLPGGHRADWMGGGTFDKSVGFSLFTLQVTHKIAADTDVERDHIVKTLEDSGDDVEVRVIKDFSSGYHSRNGGGDSIKTDGNLPVIDLAKVHVPDGGNPLGPGLDARRIARAQHRPLSTTLGVALMLVGGVMSTLATIAIVRDWRHIAEEAAGTATAAETWWLDLVLVAIAGASLLGAGLCYLLAILVFRGSNWARIAALAYTALLVVTAAIGFFTGQPVPFGSDIFGLPLDILVLLALSARSSRLWARRPRVPTAAGQKPKGVLKGSPA
ncbi:hypothetical protein JOF48_001913 [Arthrobacter stackebrandtii]|uniref:LssY-like C-terminal domain-containing protein n=1 Tax=Arthrobacter stackebrandtii TaxID=272161 RepID=A0ABS4YWL8_9MICC|nr:LssY C-terminal domain-containing protein [Arthrobacter stackebrandtii]MBP2413114.1 hypothetical protein [Arthrobacter stackebrandtii]PYH01119.1 hypothetical protein CVV67_05865 [Arthrobacter stackebrandtii]